MTLKTYLFPEVYCHPEITEWVPADVARELFEALDRALTLEIQGMSLQEQCEKALKHACGES